MTRLLAVAIAVLALTPCVVLGQTTQNQPITPLTVCQALRDLKNLSAKMVAARGRFHFTHRHGGWVLDAQLNGNPCRKMPPKARIWLSGIALDSGENPNLADGPVAFKEETPTDTDLIKLLNDRSMNAQEPALIVRLIGEIRTKKNLVVVPAPSGRGDTMGNGYGVGGAFPALLVIQTFRDVHIPGKER